MKQWRRAIIRKHKGKRFDTILDHCDCDCRSIKLPFFEDTDSLLSVGAPVEAVFNNMLDRAQWRTAEFSSCINITTPNFPAQDPT